LWTFRVSGITYLLLNCNKISKTKLHYKNKIDFYKFFFSWCFLNYLEFSILTSQKYQLDSRFYQKRCWSRKSEHIYYPKFYWQTEKNTRILVKSIYILFLLSETKSWLQSSLIFWKCTALRNTLHYNLISWKMDIPIGHESWHRLEK